MIVLCGVDEFPTGSWTQELARRFADGIGAELVVVDGGSAAGHVARLGTRGGDVLVFGHAPPRDVARTLREAPCPVVVAPPATSAQHSGGVVLGLDGGDRCEPAAAIAGVLAARLVADLGVVVLDRGRRPTGPQREDAVRRATRAAASAAGAAVAIETEVREGPAVQALVSAASERDAALVVVAADPRPTWRDALRPSFTAGLLHLSRDLVVVVPPTTAAEPQARVEPDRERVARA